MTEEINKTRLDEILKNRKCVKRVLPQNDTHLERFVDYNKNQYIGNLLYIPALVSVLRPESRDDNGKFWTRVLGDWFTLPELNYLLPESVWTPMEEKLTMFEAAFGGGHPFPKRANAYVLGSSKYAEENGTAVVITPVAYLRIVMKK